MKLAWTYNFKSTDSKRRERLGLRNRLSYAWNHFLACRGENLRGARLCDLFPHDFTRFTGTGTAQEGSQITFGVVLQMLRGKTNRHADKRFGSIIRNVDVEMCPMGSLAFYFFEKWHLKGSCPSTDSLRANAPAIHHEFRSISDRIHGLSLHMHEEFDGFTKNMAQLHDAHCDQLRQERDDRNARELNFIGTIRDVTGDVLQRFSHLHTVYSSQHERQLDLNHHRSQQDQLHTSLPQFLRPPRQPQHQLPQPYQQPQLLQRSHQELQQEEAQEHCCNSRPNSHRNNLKWKTNPENCHPPTNRYKDGYPSPSRHDCVSSDQPSEFRVCHDP
ncbi:hypothetical protein B0O80DRAFT_233996 [Mortierella sp. GBAus27b]|nr:hypothetical protein B0O80DRAFT_233996 [Mortierella sp. GBAus27b]